MTRQRLTRLLATAVTAAVVAGGVGLAPATATETTSVLTQASVAGFAAHDAEQDGQDLFRAVFFTQGDLADALIAEGVINPSAASLNTNRSSEALALTDVMIEEMSKADPDFFADLSAQLRSGDPFQVEAGLMAGTDLLNEVAAVTFGGDHAATGLVVVVVFVAIAVVATLGVAVHHSAAAVQVAVFNRSVIMGGQALDAERQIAALTRSLTTADTGRRA